MDSGNKENPSEEFDMVVDALHNKSKLPSLRTYQGDMAEFIKEKNESVISIAVKEKEKEKKKKKEEEISTHLTSLPDSKRASESIAVEKKKEKAEAFPKPKRGGFQINLTIIILSLLLIAGGALAFFYVFNAIKKGPVSQAVFQQEIIPYNNSVTLANATSGNLGPEIAGLSLSGGINIVKISDISGNPFQKSKDFLNFLKISVPPELERTLKDDYAVGVLSQNGQTSPFLVISVSDFGTAFSGMLNWEDKMAEDLSFLNPEASTTVSTTIPLKPESLSWKDLIIKNKDTRGLVNQNYQVKIIYTFLDKNTILITNSTSAIGNISSAYASRSVAR